MVKAAPVKKWQDVSNLIVFPLHHHEIFLDSHDESLAKRAFSLNIP